MRWRLTVRTRGRDRSRVSSCRAIELIRADPSVFAITVHGNAHMIGRNHPSSVLGTPADLTPFSPSSPSSSTSSSSSSVPIAVKIVAQSLPGAKTQAALAKKKTEADNSNELSPERPTRIIQAACARHHTLLVSQCGRVWACGSNPDGRLGVDVKGKGQDVSEFVRVQGPWEKEGGKVVQVGKLTRPGAVRKVTELSYGYAPLPPD